MVHGAENTGQLGAADDRRHEFEKNNGPLPAFRRGDHSGWHRQMGRLLLVLVSFEFDDVQAYLPGVCNRSDGKKDVCYGAVRFSLASSDGVKLGVSQLHRVPDFSFVHGFASQRVPY
jgi:hypothetical protein